MQFHVSTEVTESKVKEERSKKKIFNPASWSFFIIFWMTSLAFWLVQLAYQRYGLGYEKITDILISGSALTGATLISSSLFSSIIFKWKPALAKYWRLRRYLGIAGFLFTVIHVFAVIQLRFEGDFVQLYTVWNPIKNPIIFGTIAYTIILAMAITSNDWFVRKLGRKWKQLHRFVYIAYPAAIFHYLLINPSALKNIAGYLLLALTVATVAGQLYWFFIMSRKKQFKSVGFFVGVTIIIAVIIVAYFAYR